MYLHWVQNFDHWKILVFHHYNNKSHFHVSFSSLQDQISIPAMLCRKNVLRFSQPFNWLLEKQSLCVSIWKTLPSLPLAFGNTQDLEHGFFFPHKQYHIEHFQITVEKPNTNVITTNTYNRRNHDEAIRIFSKHVRNHAYQVKFLLVLLLIG